MKAKLVMVIIALLFAIGFGAGGAFGIYHLYSEVNGWWQARSWQPVAATVLATQLQESATDDGTTYKATALYRYEVNGHRYNSTRVCVSIGSDNLGNWQRNHYLQLEAARREGRTINVWVDPAQPERAVFDREIRWSMVALTVPFATVFPLVALGALWVLLKGLSAPARSYNDAPKLEPNPAEIKSDARSSARGLWLFATLWGLIAFPIALVAVPEQFGHSWTWFLVMLFPLVGIGLIWAAIVRSLRLSRHGEVLITLQPAQPRLGESLAIKAHFRVEPP